jgi:hypothetical protein
VLKSSIATRPDCEAQAKKAVDEVIEAAKSRELRYTVHETTGTAIDEKVTFLKRASYLCLPRHRGPARTKETLSVNG